MKRIASGIFIVAIMSLIPITSMAQSRYLIDTPVGQRSCIWQNGGYSDCKDPAEVRYNVDTPEGKMTCIWMNNTYSDCKPLNTADSENATTILRNTSETNNSAQTASNSIVPAANAPSPDASLNATSQVLPAQTQTTPTEQPSSAAPEVKKTVRAVPKKRISLGNQTSRIL